MKSRVRRIVHRLFFMIVALATVVVLFYAVEDWRGARAWAAAKRDLQARGETLDFRAFVPPPVPDDQNLAMAPLFTRLFQYEVDPRTGVLTFNRGAGWYKSDTYKQFEGMPFGRDKLGLHRPVPANWMTGHFLDLGMMQRYYRQRSEFPRADQPQAPADAVLLALNRYAPLLDELAQASAERPQTRFPVNYTLRPAWGISIPYYNTLQDLTLTLRLRAVAELAAGQTPAARRDLMQMFRLRQAVEHDPILVAALVDSTCVGLLIQPVWEGLAARRWSAEDLDLLRESLQTINVLQEYRQGIRGGERAGFAAHWPEDLQDTAQAWEMAKVLPPITGDEFSSSSLTLERWLWTALPYWPRGWYEQNAALASRYFQDDWIDAVDPANHRVSLAKNKDAERLMRNTPLTPDTLLAKIALPVFSGLAKKFAQTQAIVDQAVIACALEKYYLDHHAYPAALAALTPVYLDQVPNDVIDGAPMRYRLTVDGRYQLYSIGWDGQDDGGAIDWPPDRKWRRTGGGIPAAQEQPFPSPSRDQGDWVWQYAPAEPPEPPNNQSRLESLP